jgi:hypothetical protein
MGRALSRYREGWSTSRPQLAVPPPVAGAAVVEDGMEIAREKPVVPTRSPADEAKGEVGHGGL